MHTVFSAAVMAAILAAHVLMMVELRPRGGEALQDEKQKKLGENS